MPIPTKCIAKNLHCGLITRFSLLFPQYAYGGATNIVVCMAQWGQNIYGVTYITKGLSG